MKLDKRSLLKGLVGMVGLAGLPGMAKAKQGSEYPPRPIAKPLLLGLGTMNVAGIAYYDAARVLPYLKVGDALELRRQPDNPHDTRAIEVWFKATYKLGYVPRAENRVLSRLLDQCQNIRAFVQYIHPDQWDGIRMKLYLTDRNT